MVIYDHKIGRSSDGGKEFWMFAEEVHESKRSSNRDIC